MTRQDVTRMIAADLKIPATRVHKIMGAVENEIAKNLKSKGRVKFQGFGTFYLIRRQSRAMKLVKSGISRVLLEHQMIKFVAAPALKGELMSKDLSHSVILSRRGSGDRAFSAKDLSRMRDRSETPARRSLGAGGSSEILRYTQNDRNKESPKPSVTESPQKSANFKPVELKKFGVHQRLSREDFDKILRQRLSKLAGKLNNKPKSQAAQSDLTAEERVLIALIKRVEKEGTESLEFSINETDQVMVRTGKPRKSLANLPKSSIVEILRRFFDIDNFKTTHERFVKLSTNSKIISDRWIQVHSLPTADGASVYVRIFRRAEG